MIDGVDDRSPTFNSFNYKNVDLRSDMKTMPTKKMRESVLTGIYGDMDNLTDPTVEMLENYVKNFLGKEYGLMVGSGTMANLIISLLDVGPKKEEYVLAGDISHSLTYEKPMLYVGGVNYIPLPTLTSGVFDFKNEVELEQILVDFHKNNKVNLPFEDFLSKIKLLLVENTHNYLEGKILPVEYPTQLRNICLNLGKKYPQFKVKMGLDGSRVLHAAIEQQVDPKVLCKEYDILHISCTKIVGGPLGNIICMNSYDDFLRVKYLRKGAGGGMRQAGISASMILTGFENLYEKLRYDHKNSRLLEEGLDKIKDVRAEKNRTNLVRIFLEGKLKGKEDLLVKLLEDKYKVLMYKFDLTKDVYIRAAFHYQVSTKQTEYTIFAWEQVINEINNSSNAKF